MKTGYDPNLFLKSNPFRDFCEQLQPLWDALAVPMGEVEVQARFEFVNDY